MALGVKVSLMAAAQALLVRFIYAMNGIILTFFVNELVNEPYIFLLNALLVLMIIEVAVTLQYNESGEWTWFIPSVFIYLIWVVPCILTLEIYALNFRNYVVGNSALSTCPITFEDECQAATTLTEGASPVVSAGGTVLLRNITDGKLTIETHDQSRRLAMLFQQIMMLIVIFGRWMAPKGNLTRDQLSSLLLALTAMTVDMLEFSTDSLSIQAVACDQIYFGFVIVVWCWSLLQIPLGLTAVKQRKPRPAGTIQSPHDAVNMDEVDAEAASSSCCCTPRPCDRHAWKARCCCCCESEIWSLMVSICMQDGPYLVLRLYIMISAGYFGETLIFFAAKNAIIVLLQSYRILIKIGQYVDKRRRSMRSFRRGEDIPHRVVAPLSHVDNVGFESEVDGKNMSDMSSDGGGASIGSNERRDDPEGNGELQGNGPTSTPENDGEVSREVETNLSDKDPLNEDGRESTGEENAALHIDGEDGEHQNTQD